MEQITTIVRGLKTFAHPSVEPSTIDLNAAVQNTLLVARSEYKYVADVVQQLDPDIGTLYAVEGELKQALLNLVVNAAHAIADRTAGRSMGTIVVRTTGYRRWVRVSVTDDGCGIKRDLRERIFEPFFTTKEVGRGTGQGLALVHSVVRRMGGRIEVESEVGRGSTFTLTLPRVVPDRGTTEPPIAGEEAPEVLVSS